MAHQLGPETPRPFAVLSEGHLQQEMTLPSFEEKERFSFGPFYEKTLCELIHKHLELGTDDKLCYVGQEKGSIAELLTREFCLLEPVMSMEPGVIHYEESQGHHMVPVHLPNVGAQDYFQDEARAGQFDKVLLNDCVHFFTQPKQTYLHIMRALSTRGRLLIILRPTVLNTLPLFQHAVSRLSSLNEDYMKIIKDLQDLYFDVSWEIECISTIMTKNKWLSMLRDKFPPSLEIVSQQEMVTGIRELSEGIFKYSSDVIEFKDRLLFISATQSTFSSHPSVQRRSADVLPYPGLNRMYYKMEVTPELRQYVPPPEKPKPRSERKPAPEHFRKAAVTILP